MSGRLVVMGSGELAPALLATHRSGLAAAETDAVTILDTPFGFQENADELTERLVDFFETSLRVEATVASWRRPGGARLEREKMLAAVRRSRYVFAGPGSPSYALRSWRDTALGDALEHVVRSGGTVVFASAAALTLGTKTLPVYEIYKVGEDPYWLDGLGVTSRLGLPIVVVPHWNNAEGGTHDTSCCYVGERRFRSLEAQLTGGVLGVDEHSAAAIDFGEGTLAVTGLSGAVLRGGAEKRLESGVVMELEEAAEWLKAPPPPAFDRVPARGAGAGFAEAMSAGDASAALAALLVAEEAAAADSLMRGELRAMIVELGRAAHAGLADPREAIAPFVEMLLDRRDQDRSEQRWAAADAIRDGLAEAGVEVRDTPDGVDWHIAG